MVLNNRLGDESVGWIGLLGLHSPTNQFIYDVYIDTSQVSKFEDSGIMGGDLDGLIDAADDAAYRWNSTGVVTFQKYVDGTNQTGLFGSITAYDFRDLDFVMPEDKTAEAVTQRSANSQGHIVSWTIYINIREGYTTRYYTIVHEMGHAIGLGDLYQSSNSNKIMYGYSNDAVRAPSTQDILGAKVVLGQSVSHVWNDYEVYNTINGNSQHRTKCSTCRAYKVDSDGNFILQMCAYDSSDRCIDCGAPRGASINSDDKDIVYQ